MKRHNKSRSLRRQQRASVFNRNTFQLLEERRMLATFTVNSLADGVPDATDGLTTLREAIIAANDETANPGEDFIVFQSGLTGQIALTEGELVITEDLTITGPGAAADLVIDAQQNSRVIRVISNNSNKDLTLDSLTITNGTTTGRGAGILFEGVGGGVDLIDSTVSGNTSGGDGGGIYLEASVDFYGFPRASVSLLRTTVSANTSGGGGGGIVALSLGLINSTVSGNEATEDGGGIFTRYGNVTLTNSTVSGNVSGKDGGGIDARVVSLNTSTISGNTSGEDGGGINSALAYLNNSTISGNRSGEDGGGIRSSSRVATTNSTVSGNTSGGLGGGVSAFSATVRNSIIAGNSDNGTAPDINDTNTLTATTVQHSIIGDTTGAVLTAGGDSQLNVDFTTVLETEVAGGVTVPRLTNNGGSVETIALIAGSPAIDAGDNALAIEFGFEFGISTDQRGDGFERFIDGDGDGIRTVDIGAVEFDSFLLGDVSQNGAVDFLDIGPFISLLSNGVFLSEADIDQNGVVDFLDIGPFISILSMTSNSKTFTVNSLADGAPDASDGLTTLREAIVAANDAANPGADFIVFEAGLTGEILLDATQGELLITSDLTITGPGAAGDLVIDAQQNSRVIRVTEVAYDVTLDSLTLANGRTTGSEGGGGIRFAGLPGSTLTLVNGAVSGSETTSRSTEAGSGISATSGHVTLTNSSVSGSTSPLSSGGIYTYFGDVTLNSSMVDNSGGIGTRYGAVTLTNSTISGNTSLGGGIRARYGDVALTNSDVSGNTTASNGGGIWAYRGAVTLNNSTVSENEARGDGGGIFALSGDVTLTNNSTVSGNTSGEDGGGIFSGFANLNLIDSTASGNTSGARGGGIFSRSVTLTNSTVSRNTSGANGGGISSRSVTLTNSTIAGNTSANNGGGLNTTTNGAVTLTNSTISGNTSGGIGGGIRFLPSINGESLTVHNSIIAGNSDNGTAPDLNTPGTGNVTVEHSIIGDTTGTGLTAGNDNQLNVDFTTVLETEVVNGATVPLLTDNGGPVETIALLAGSPAIDAGDNALAVDGLGDPLLTDQRGTGFGRLIDGDADGGGTTVDIGAIEFGSSFLLGDASQDGVVDFLDIGPFISLLSSGNFLNEADIDRSGVVDFLDIGPFIGILTGAGSNSLSAISQLIVSSPAPSLLASESVEPSPSAFVGAWEVQGVGDSGNFRRDIPFRANESALLSSTEGQAIRFADQERTSGSDDSVVSLLDGDLESATWKSSGDLFDAHPDLLDGLADAQLDEAFEELFV